MIISRTRAPGSGSRRRSHRKRRSRPAPGTTPDTSWRAERADRVPAPRAALQPSTLAIVYSRENLKTVEIDGGRRTPVKNEYEKSKGRHRSRRRPRYSSSLIARSVPVDRGVDDIVRRARHVGDVGTRGRVRGDEGLHRTELLQEGVFRASPQIRTDRNGGQGRTVSRSDLHIEPHDRRDLGRGERASIFARSPTITIASARDRCTLRNSNDVVLGHRSHCANELV